MSYECRQVCSLEGRAVSRATSPKTWIRVYAVWFALVGVVQILGALDTRAPRDWYTIGAEVATGLLALAVWYFRAPLRSLLGRVRLTGFVGFLILGLVAAAVGEFFYFMSESPGIVFPVFWLRTLGWYTGWFTAWWLLSLRFKLSLTRIFFLAGFNGYLVETVLLGQAIPFAPVPMLLYPLVATFYGALIMTAAVPTDIRISDEPVRVLSGQTLLVMLLPLVAFIPGALWMALVDKVFGA